jgi:hypothetical protein
MHLVTKSLAGAWIAVGGVIGASAYGVGAAPTLSGAIFSASGPFSVISILGGVTVAYIAFDVRVGRARRKREAQLIIKDKPRLAKDPAGLKRERRIRTKERRLQRSEQRVLRREARLKVKERREWNKVSQIEQKKAKLKKRT